MNKQLTAGTAVISMLGGLETRFTGLIASFGGKKIVVDSKPHGIAKANLAQLCHGVKDVLSIPNLEQLEPADRTIVENKVGGLKRLMQRASNTIWDTPAASQDYRKLLDMFDIKSNVVALGGHRQGDHDAGHGAQTSRTGTQG